MIKRKSKSGWKNRPIGKKIKKSRAKNIHKNLWLRIIILIMVVLFGLTIFFGVVLAWLNYSLPDPDKLLQRQIIQSTKIYDRTGQNILYEIFAEERRSLVKLEDIPDNLIHATLVSEDQKFFDHPGFDFKAILRAILVDLIRGDKVQGGSTLTQQFIKNAFLTPEKTYVRKIKELLLAYKIEKKYSKQEILQMYFNEIPYGSNAYGVAAAAQIYFNKSVKDLSLDECALLAALPKAPTYYSPYGNHQNELVARQKYILQTLVNQGYLSQEMATQAQKTNTLEKIIPRWENITAPHFVMYLKEILTEKYGQRLVEQGGLKVITTLDLKKQQLAEKAIDSQAEKNAQTFNASNAALVAIDVKTGQVLALVGSKDFFDESIDGQVNVALRPRQPGSSFKPIVYAAAFSKGYTPETILFDVPTNFGPSGTGKDYLPKNYNEKYYGPVTIRQALAGSLNVPAVKTLYLTGINNVLNLAQRMGYTTLLDESRYGLSLVLGGGEVKLLEHVNAFGIFAREGKKISPSFILKVEDGQGNILEQNDNLSALVSPQVLTPQITRLINDILSDNQARSFVFGEKNYLTLPDRPVAAKTGTTNNFHDAWTIGYTPSLVAGVWVGNSRNEAMGNHADGSTVAAPIWQEFMSQSLANTPIEKFTPPEPIIIEKPILKGEIPGEIELEIDQASGKLATELTPESQKITKTFKEYYPLLYYVDKDNPRGEKPLNPLADPQYDYWQEGIKEWLREQAGEKFNIPPVEYDDVHVPSNQPQLEIISSPENVTEQLIEIKINAQAPRGIEKIICQINGLASDNIFPQTGENPPYSCYLNFAGFKSGEHQITVTAFDDVENKKSIDFNLILEQSFSQKISWLNPSSDQTISQNIFPLDLQILAPAGEIKIIRFYAQNLKTSKISLLGTIFSPENRGKINFSWASADKGTYQIWTEIISESNQVLISDRLEIEIK
jgi:1A family penicillin-binding protein